MALKKRMVLLHESDARYGAFDFRVAYEQAPPDLCKLLDDNESLVSFPFVYVSVLTILLLLAQPFRRRGYEVNGSTLSCPAQYFFSCTDLSIVSTSATG